MQQALSNPCQLKPHVCYVLLGHCNQLRDKRHAHHVLAVPTPLCLAGQPQTVCHAQLANIKIKSDARNATTVHKAQSQQVSALSHAHNVQLDHTAHSQVEVPHAVNSVQQVNSKLCQACLHVHHVLSAQRSKVSVPHSVLHVQLARIKTSPVHNNVCLVLLAQSKHRLVNRNVKSAQRVHTSPHKVVQCVYPVLPVLWRL